MVASQVLREASKCLADLRLGAETGKMIPEVYVACVRGIRASGLPLSYLGTSEEELKELCPKDADPKHWQGIEQYAPAAI